MGRKPSGKEPKAGRYVKDAQHPHLFRNSKTGRYYVRKYHTEAGPLFRSTGETNRHLAIQQMNQLLLEWARADPEAKHDPDFDAVADEVIECYQGKAKKTYDSIEGTIRLHLSPTFSGMRISQVARHWEKHKALSRKLRPNRSLYHDRRYFLRILKHAKEREYIDSVPDIAQDPQDKYTPKGREITSAELRLLLERLPASWQFKVRFLRSTGARAGELRLLRWEHIDFKERLIRVPAEITKTRTGREYYITGDLLAELKARKLKSKSLYVCPNRLDPARPESATDKSWQRAKKGLGMAVKRHWLRYAAASDAARAGIPMVITEKGLGLSEAVAKRVYVQVNKRDRMRLANAMSKGLKRK